MSKARRGSRAEAEETGREDGHRPRLHQERLQEDDHTVRRDQEPLSEMRRALQPACVCADCIRTPSGTRLQAWTDLPESRPSPALRDHRPGDGAPLSASGLARPPLSTSWGYLAGYYAPTEAAILQAILKSDFVHVDETKINIQGVDHYVWVFTDGKHVVFRMTETREADIVREVLAGYQGVLVSDFYPGYDSMPCRQQKCLVHLIRDINDDLWKAPFDKELEAFAVEVQALLVPILGGG